MEREEVERETFTAADVILLIIRNEGELVDDIEYPQEFINAYAMLQAFDVIRSQEGKFISGPNFGAATKLGVQNFVERELARAEAEKNRGKQVRKVGIAALSTAVVAAAGYLYRRKKKGSEKDLNKS